MNDFIHFEVDIVSFWTIAAVIGVAWIRFGFRRGKKASDV